MENNRAIFVVVHLWLLWILQPLRCRVVRSQYTSTPDWQLTDSPDKYLILPSNQFRGDELVTYGSR